MFKTTEDNNIVEDKISCSNTIEIDKNNKSIIKLFKEKLIVKSNKKNKKIELKNLEKIKEIEENIILEPYTKNELSKIKNIIFKNNIYDIEKHQIVSSIRLLKQSKLGNTIQPMVWEYYRHRGNLDVNEIIKKYGRDNLVINYSIGNISKLF
jgi:hypothetical protein